jgi:hypothetical protein
MKLSSDYVLTFVCWCDSKDQAEQQVLLRNKNSTLNGKGDHFYAVEVPPLTY